MTTERVVIEGATRATTGKEYAHKLRRAGKIPGNFIDTGKSIAIELDPKLLSKAWKGDRCFTLSFEGKQIPVKIQELQIDHVKRLPLHVDLIRA